MFQFWRQLALAGLIEGSYSGLSNSTNGYDTLIGTNVPRSKMNNAGWGVQGAGNYGGDTEAFAADYGNIFHFGAQTSAFWPLGQVLKPEEAWNIDTKLDDGKPGTGRVIPYHWPGCTNAASKTDNAAAVYALSSSTISCALYFARAF